jgi:hypothetical protein
MPCAAARSSQSRASIALRSTAGATQAIPPEHQLGLAVAALSGGAEPASGGYAIHRQVLIAAMKRAQREHCTAMALVGRFGEQLQGGIQVARTTAAVRHHLSKSDLGVRHAGFGRSAKPSSPVWQIAIYTVTFSQHPAVDVLRICYAVSRAPQPVRGSLFVALDPHTSRQADAQIESGYQITGLRRVLEPFRNDCAVVWRTIP